MRFASRPRQGFALVIALLAIVIIGGLIAGVLSSALEQYRTARNSAQQARASVTAEDAQDSLLATWNPAWNSGLAVGRDSVRGFAWSDGSVDSVHVTKLSPTTFLVVSEGWAKSRYAGTARRRTGILVRLKTAQVRTLGALTSRGTTSIGGSSYVNGNDTSFVGWNCPPKGAAIPGVTVPSLSNLTWGGTCTGGGLGCTSGNPAIKIDTMARDTSTYFRYGDQDWNSLKALASKTVSGTLTGVAPKYRADGSCDTGNNLNWGDPARNLILPGKCEDYFPVVYAPGDLAVNGNVGQGILLVEGNLSVQGGFQFYGIVIVRGQLKTTGTGGHFNGAVMAANVDLGQNLISGNSTIQYSRCAINSALNASAPAARVRDRAWVELY